MPNTRPPSPTAPGSLPAELTDVGVRGLIRRYGDMTMHAVLDVRQNPRVATDHAALVRAFDAVVDAFPVVDFRYRMGLLADRWERVASPRRDAVIDEPSADIEEATRRWVSTPVDPDRERPVRVVRIARETGVRLILSASHLAVDGAGVASVGNVLGAALYGVAPTAPTESRRDIFTAIDGLPKRAWVRVAAEIARSTIALRELAKAALRVRPYPSDPRTPHGWARLRISETELQQRRDRLRTADGARATVNDHVVAAAARVAAERSHDGPVIVTYTLDLRRYGSAPRLLATNASSICHTMVSRQGVASPEEAVREVAETTKRQRDRLSALAFILSPYALGRTTPHMFARATLDALAPMLVEDPMRRGLLITNVGRIDEALAPFGDDIENLRFVGPTAERFPLPIVVALGFRGALHLEVYAPPGFGEASAVAMRDELQAELGGEVLG